MDKKRMVLERKQNPFAKGLSEAVAFFRKRRWFCDLALGLFLALVVCLLTCTSLSPLYPAENFDYLNGDSNLFRYMAWLWLQGKTPYLDFYDHKGLYHIAIDALGLLIGGRYGIWLLEILFSAFNLFLLARCVRLLKGDDLRWRLLLYGLYLLMFSLLGQGNSEGEWVLPFVNLFLYGYLSGLAKKRMGYFLLGSFFMGLEVGLAFNSRPLDALWGGMGALYFIVYGFQQRRPWAILGNALIAILGCAIPFAVFYPMALQGGYFSQMIDAVFLQNGTYLYRQFTTVEVLPILNRVLVVAALVYYFFSYHLLRKNQPERKDLTFFFFFMALGVSFLYFFLLGYFHYFQAGFGFFGLYVVYSLSAFPPLRKADLRKTVTLAIFSAAVVYDAVFVVGYYSIGIADFSYRHSQEIAADVLALPAEDRAAGKVFAIDCDAAVYLDGAIPTGERFMTYTTWWSKDNAAVVPEVIDYLSGDDKPKWLLVSTADYKTTDFDEVIAQNYAFVSEPNTSFDLYLAKADQA